MSNAAERGAALVVDLKIRAAKSRKLGVRCHLLNIEALVLTLFSTAVAVTYGIMPNHSSQITAALGLIPGGLALVATSLKLEQRANWHFQQEHAIESLLRIAQYEWSDPPSEQDIATGSRALSTLLLDMEKSWSADLGIDWGEFRKR